MVYRYIILLQKMSSTNWAFEDFPALGTSEDTFALFDLNFWQRESTQNFSTSVVASPFLTKSPLLILRYTLVDILRAILLSLEAMIEDPELQVNGFVLIIDWSNFTFKQASKLTPSMLRLAIEGLQVPSLFSLFFLILLRFADYYKSRLIKKKTEAKQNSNNLWIARLLAP